MISLPIPVTDAPIRYEQLSYEGHNLGDLVEQLTRNKNNKIRRSCPAHLDPDLAAATLPRKPGWRPLFGQVGAAEGHLEKQGVGQGDIFLFWGLFRRVVRADFGWDYAQGERRQHVLFGWL